MSALGPRQPYWLPLVVAGILALMTYWLAHLSRLPLRFDMAGFEHVPDYVVENFQATTFNTAGRPDYRLAAARMAHYMDDGTTRLEQPRFSREGETRTTLQASAERGQISSDGDNVHLLGQVRLEKLGERQPPLILETEYLHIVPEADIIRTDKPVTIRQGAAVISAGAMELDGGKRTLLLSHGVKGIYETRQ